MSATSTNLSQRAALTAMIGVGGQLKDATAHLFDNNTMPTGNSVKADFIEATFDGYVSGGIIVWGTPFTDIDGNEHVVGPTIQSTVTGTTTTPTIYGWFALSVASGTPLLMAERFPTPIEITAIGQALFYTPDYQLGK